MTKTFTRIQPLLSKEATTLKWKTDINKSAIDNLNNILDKIITKIEEYKNNKLSAQEHIKTKQIIIKALEEMGQNIPSILLLKEAINKPLAKKKADEISKKPSHILLRELLHLLVNERNLRTNSVNYDEAWIEIETNYFLKISLYQAELNKRQGV